MSLKDKNGNYIVKIPEHTTIIPKCYKCGEKSDFLSRGGNYSCWNCFDKLSKKMFVVALVLFTATIIVFVLMSLGWIQ